jgi:hypothetical protein
VQTNSHLASSFAVEICPDRLACFRTTDSCHRISTKVEFTDFLLQPNLAVSSSGGGLFGRPAIRKGSGALLKFLRYFRKNGGSGSADPSARGSEPPKLTFLAVSCKTA